VLSVVNNAGQAIFYWVTIFCGRRWHLFSMVLSLCIMVRKWSYRR